jgi:hypothetical protein
MHEHTKLECLSFTRPKICANNQQLLQCRCARSFEPTRECSTRTEVYPTDKRASLLRHEQINTAEKKLCGAFFSLFRVKALFRVPLIFISHMGILFSSQ